MLNRIILVTGLILVMTGVGIFGYGLGQKNPTLVDRAPISIKRCKENSDNYKLQFGPIESKLIKKADLWQKAETIVVSEGRHQGDVAIPLRWFFEEIGEGRALEVQPCIGNPVIISYEKIANDPERYVLVRSDNGALKLMDFKNNLKKPILKKIHLFRVLPNRGRKSQG